MKLEHCPFCGGKGHISLTIDFLFVPWCDNKACILSEGTTKGFDSEEAAAQAWNNRQVEEIKSNFDDLDKEIQYRSGLAMSNFEDLLTMDSLNLALFLGASDRCPPTRPECFPVFGDCVLCWKKWLDAPHLEVIEDGKPIQPY